MAPQNAVSEELETADQYGRHEKCFLDHQAGAFCFHGQISDLQRTIVPAGTGELLEQSGLIVSPIPQPSIQFDTIDAMNAVTKQLVDSPQPSSLTVPPLLAELAVLKESLVSVSDLDLGPSADVDVEEYLKEVESKRCCNLFDQWLPLSPVKVDKDEGISFPPNSSRLLSLLIREVELESIQTSQKEQMLTEEALESPWTLIGNDSLEHYKEGKKSGTIYPDPLTPPLSPLSSPGSPFVPDGDVAVIDLTSDPTSPLNGEARRLQIIIDMGYPESEPAAPSTKLESSSPLKPMKLLHPTRPTAQDIKVEVPMIAASSDTISGDGLFSNLNTPSVIVEDLGADDGQIETYFEDALRVVLEDRHSHTTKVVNQERLNPMDSISRISVPVLDFEIQQPGWVTSCSSAKQHLLWLRAHEPTAFGLPSLPRDVQLDIGLKWTPVPPKGGRISLPEQLDPLTINSQDYLMVGSAPSLSSASHFANKPSLAILRLLDDDEIEPLNTVLDDEFCHEIDEAQHVAGCGVPTTSNEHNLDSIIKRNAPNIMATLRRNFDVYFDDMPSTNDISATSKLLNGFMQLRAAKKPRMTSKDANVAPKTPKMPGSTNSLIPPTALDQISSSSHEKAGFIPAVAPSFEVPEEKGHVIFSIDLPRPILRRIEEYWLSENLVDKDYSSHGSSMPVSEEPREREMESSLAAEADISLSPSVGIILTTLLKVRQRPLPGSHALPPLRDRTKKVGCKYEKLFILVSENNQEGEFAAELSPSDVAVYADFVRFTVVIGADVCVYFSAGAKETLAMWILSIMCCVSRDSSPVNGVLTSEETTWVVFLRRVGMNIVAAQVLSRTLFEEFGNAGLANFVSMGMAERIARYSQLLGGQKLLMKAGEVLDFVWE